ncbi:MAG: monovalent cation/H+ antiporter subunit D family protein [Deltaproteobacteria bacterium]|nr:MAG: monovalent cation/H+ antiporter subunit D family protein [Deltaproteobacteria bacterium]
MSLHSPVLAVVIPLICAFLALLFGWWRKNLCYPITLVALSSSFLASLNTLHTVITTGTIRYHLGNWNPPWGIEYVVDHLNALVLGIISCIILVVGVYSKRSVEQELPEKIVFFYTLYLLLATGLFGIVVTGDMFNLYVFLEIASLAGYALIAIGEDGAPLASFRYVIMGTIGACFYLLGVGYLYIATGSLNMADLSQMLPELYDSRVVLVAFTFFMVGLALKMALFPLHTWLPDAYTHAPSTVSALLAPTMTKVGAYVMIRIMFTVFKPDFSISLFPITSILGWLAAAAILFGSIMALAQVDLKRMLCFVVVAEIGYIGIGVGIANRTALIGAILHIVNDVFMMACLFLAVGAIVYKIGTRNIYRFRYLHRKMPLMMALFVAGGLSVVGIPPLCGFFSKWYLILGAFKADKWIFVAVILVSSLLNAILFFRVIENVYLEPPEAGRSLEEIPTDEAPLSMLLPMFVVVAGIILLGVFSGRIIDVVIQFAIPPSI